MSNADAERYRAMEQNTFDLICELQNDRYTYVSPNYRDVLGYEPEELLGTSVIDLIHPDDLPQAIAQATVAVETRRPTRGVVRCRHKNGEWRWFESTGTTFRAPTGEFRGVGISRDITERKLAEEALQRSEELLRRSEANTKAILAAIPDMMFRMTRDGVYLDFKASAEDLYVPAEQIVGRGVKDLLPADVSARALDQIQGALDLGEVRVFEYQLPMPEGPRDYEARIRKSGDNEIVAIVRDITKHKAMLEELERSQSRLRLRNKISTAITAAMSIEQRIGRAVGYIAEEFSDVRVAYSAIDSQGNLTVLHSIEPPGMPPLAGLSADLRVAPAYLHALRAGEPVVLGDIAADPRMAPLVSAMTAGGTRAVLDVPLQHSRELVGLLCFASSVPREWSDHEVATLREVAEYLSITVQDARNLEERQRAEAQSALLRERARIAQDLHDNVAQFFFSIGLTARQLLEQGAPADLWPQFDHILRMAGQGGSEIRKAVYALSSMTITGSLTTSLEELADEFRASEQIDVRWLPGDRLPQIAPEASGELYAAAREALRNVAKHAAATRVQLRLTAGESTVVVAVQDNGRGAAARIRESSEKGTAFGLRNLRQRFEALGGQLSIMDNADGGVTVAVQLPCGER